MLIKNAELKGKIEELPVQQQKGFSEVQVVIDMEKKIKDLESKCISMNALKANENLVKFCTGLPDYLGISIWCGRIYCV